MKRLLMQRYSRPAVSLTLLAALSLFALLLASACGSKPPGQPTPTPTLTPTATFPPTLTPTPQPFGSQSRPFVIGLVSETEDTQMVAAADTLARRLSEITKKNFIGKVYPSYSQLLDDMEQEQVQAAWMPPLTYLYASQREIARVTLLTNHFGVYAYGAQFLANVDSRFTPYYDPISGLPSADAATALAQFQDMRPCWVDPGSPSGYVIPAGLLRLNEISSQPAVLAQGHSAVVRALYIKGICDFGATYSISGDPRTASAVLQDLPDVMNRVLIIWRSDAVIPNFSLALQFNLSEADRQTITKGFLDLVKAPDGKDLLSLSAGDYQIDDIKAVSEEVYDPLRDAAQALDLNLFDMIGK